MEILIGRMILAIFGHLHPNQLRKLNSYDCVNEIEDEGMDEGRFFVHLEQGFQWKAPYEGRTKSFGSFSDARYYLDKFVEKS